MKILFRDLACSYIHHTYLGILLMIVHDACEDEIRCEHRHNIHVEMLLDVETYMIYVWRYDNCTLIHTKYIYGDLIIVRRYINGT